ncbi:hypothetical protein R3W88_026982 [Solanum pinnatisectum]|uniref:Reverse transcriptase domain-containing protein n=1 Tax=Solanum pinnatisectum TaxID=50273 RepID=A0AAV9LFG2_9SOLN|nr:hypothetical protein R3W88_026982 [Solanum pinnatisectum]
MWALKKLNLDWGAASSQRLNDMNELDEFCLKAYESSALYKKKMKKYHDEKIKKCEFVAGDLVFLFNSRVCMLPGKLKSRWTVPFRVTQVFPHGPVELKSKEGMKFKVNGHRIKIYLGSESRNEVIEAWYLDEVLVIKVYASCNDVKSSAAWEATQDVRSSQL